MTPASTALEVRNLRKAFDGHEVVRDLTLTVTKGEIVSLLGPSGCGKTTALRMIAGLERPDAGAIRISGRPVFGEHTNLPPEKRGIGMVFQSYAVWPHRTVLENVSYPLGLRRDPRARAAAEEALARVRLPGFGDRYPDTLSGGQQQRVALARALVARPELLLFDEPLSNLDAKLREEMRHEVRALVKSAEITSLYVTHDQPEAFAVSDRVAIVLRGMIAQVGAPREIYESPADLETARFVGRLSLLGPVRRAGDAAVLGAAATDATVPATFSASAERSSRWILGVRPESVDLVIEREPNTVPGRILRSTFLGDRVEISAETPCGEVRADVESNRRYSEGDKIHLRLRSGRVFGAET